MLEAPKPIARSKIIHLNGALAVLAAVSPHSIHFLEHHARAVVIGHAVANIVLRFFTHGSVSLEMPDMKSLLRLGCFFLLLLPMLFLMGCATIPNQQLDPGTFYKRDMQITVNGVTREGVLVAPRKSSYAFDVVAKGDLDLFTFETCHREEEQEDAGTRGIFGIITNKRETKGTYVPAAPIETTGSCVVRLGGYERTQGRHSWAMIDFEDTDATLPAQVLCNGENYHSNGVTVCQSKQGLIEQIAFPVETVVKGSDACPMPQAPDGKTYQFKMPPRECVYAFTEVAPLGKQRRHRLTTLGYSAILIRGK